MPTTYTFALAATIFVAPYVVIRFHNWCDWRKEKTKIAQNLGVPCPHGVPAGLTKDLCPVCRAQRLQAEEQRLQAEEERKAEEQAKQQEERCREETAIAAIRFNQDQYKAYIQRQSQNIDFLRAVTPQKFEDIVAEMFRALGWAVKQTPYTNDSGMDAVLSKDGRKFLLECKRHTKVIGRPMLNAFLGVMTAEKAEGGFFVTTSSFSYPAKEFAANNNITLVDATKLVVMMDEAYPSQVGAEVLQLMCPVCSEIVDVQNVGGNVLFHEEEQLCSNGHFVKIKNVALMLSSKLSVSEMKSAKPSPKKLYTSKRSSRKPYKRYRRRY